MEREEHITSSQRETPMGVVWLIVLTSMLGTAAIGYAIHTFRFNAIRTENAALVADVRARSVELTEYLSVLEQDGITGAERWLIEHGVSTSSEQLI